MAAGIPPNFLVVLFDSLSVTDVVNALIGFLHTYCLLHRENRLVVIAHGVNGSHVIVPNVAEWDSTSTVSYVPWLPSLSATLTSSISKVIESERNSTQRHPKRHLSSALSTALTILRQQKAILPVQARILLLQFDKDRPQNYNAVMNCIFSAQKLEVCVDAMVCSSFDSHLLQQVCFLTEGQYLRHGDGMDLLLFLQTHFLADKTSRVLLCNPTQKLVDFKASCHCHQKPVEFAYMCSVCLTLLCAVPAEKCPVCETPLKIPC